MGKISSQGVFAFWLLRLTCLSRPLSCIGYRSEGLQVRDLLHVDGLVELIDLQLDGPRARWNGFLGNVGSRRAGQPLAAPDDHESAAG